VRGGEGGPAVDGQARHDGEAESVNMLNRIHGIVTAETAAGYPQDDR
jgi:hypothetical protein